MLRIPVNTIQPNYSRRENIVPMLHTYLTRRIVIGLVVGAVVGLTELAPVTQASVADAWSTVAAVPTPRDSHYAETIDGLIYAGQGVHPGGGPNQGRLDRYDPETDSWTQVTVPSNTSCRASATVGGKLYAFSGFAGPSTEAEVYDPVTDSWSDIASMPTPHACGMGAAVDGRIYVIGGSKQFGFHLGSTAIDVYNPATDQWNEEGSLAPMPRPRLNPYGAAVGGKIYVFGGKAGPDGLTVLDVVDVYDLSTDTWSTLGTPMPQGRIVAAAAVIDEMILVIGGMVSDGGGRVQTSSVAKFDPAIGDSLDAWTACEPMLTPRGELAAAVVDGIVYAIAGNNETGHLDVVEAYDPTKDETCFGMSRNLVYYGLGDSVASGHGLEGDPDLFFGCHLAPGAYPELLAMSLSSSPAIIDHYTEFDHMNFACSGALAVDRTAKIDLSEQIDMVVTDLKERSSGTDALVSITIGADYFPFSPVSISAIAGFTLLMCSGQETFDYLLGQILTLVQSDLEQSGLADLVNQRNVYVVVTDYHNPFNELSNRFSQALFGQVFPTIPSPCLIRFAGVPIGERYDDLWLRTEEITHRLAVVLNDVAGSLPIGSAAVAPIHGEFHGHESPRPLCGLALPNPDNTWVQSRFLGLDCYHPNATGTEMIAGFVEEVALDLLPVGSGVPPSSGPISFTTDRDGNLEIYVINLDGSGLTNLTNNDITDHQSSWSPDGTKFAFISDETRDGNEEIYVMNADGSNRIRLTNSPGRDTHPKWSADGRRIVWESDRNGPRFVTDIFLMDAVDDDGDGNGDNLIPLIVHPAVDARPDLGPDDRLVFMSSRDHGEGEIYVLDGSGTPQRLTFNEQTDDAPMWSPDGTKIVFHSGRDENIEIYVMDANGDNQTRLTKDPAQDSSPEWSPDGTQIVFDSQRELPSDIFVMDAVDVDGDGNGDNLIPVTTDPADNQNPSWGPG